MPFEIRRLRACPCGVGIHLDEGVQPVVEGGDALEAGVDDGARGGLAASKLARELDERAGRKLGIHRRILITSFPRMHLTSSPRIHLTSFPRTRESSVLRSTTLDPRVRGDDVTREASATHFESGTIP